MNSCPLCNSPTVRILRTINAIDFYECSSCSSVFKGSEFYPTNDEEYQRYLKHNNDISCPDYQNFVNPIVAEIKKDHNPKSVIGLDYGAGPGPVIAHLLSDQNYRIELYDPFFHPNRKSLERTYDFIICCEVIEHFKHPKLEFHRLYNLLKPGGKLYCMTELVPKEIELENWHYIRDTTHIFFYSKQSMHWIKNYYSYTNVTIHGRLIVFTKS